MKKLMHGILYLDKAPKLVELIPTAIAKITAKVKQNNIRGSRKGIEINLIAPPFRIK
jgi:hypothetical protein